MPLSDQEILERFGRRFSAIERQVPATAPFRPSRRPRGLGRFWLAPAAAVLVLVALAAGPFFSGRPSVALPSPLGSPTATPHALAPTGPSELDVQVVVEPPAWPSGVRTTGMMGAVDFAARVERPDGTLVTSWAVPISWPGQPSRAPVVFIGAGSYRLTVWRFSTIDNADTGVRSTTAPVAQCSTGVTLTPSYPTRLIADFAYAPSGSCSMVSSTIPASSLPPSEISVAQAIALARQHTTFPLVAVSVEPAGSLDVAQLHPTSGLVWAVYFAGISGEICGPMPAVLPGSSFHPTCFPPRSATVTVYLDYGTGAFLSSAMSAPAP